MPTCTLPYNPVLASVSYDNVSLLELEYKKGFIKQYHSVPKDIAYGLIYSKTPLTYFNEKIKNQFKTNRK